MKVTKVAQNLLVLSSPGTEALNFQYQVVIQALTAKGAKN
ncbi:hypothetical protein GCM10009677_42610 [Sphaerisporangium rubeum]